MPEGSHWITPIEDCHSMIRSDAGRSYLERYSMSIDDSAPAGCERDGRDLAAAPGNGITSDGAAAVVAPVGGGDRRERVTVGPRPLQELQQHLRRLGPGCSVRAVDHEER